MLAVVELTFKMLTYYGDASGVPRYINMLEDAHKKAQWDQLPTPDITLMAISTKSILQAQAFTHEIK